MAVPIKVGPNGKSCPDGHTQFFTTPGRWEDAVLLPEGAKEGAR